MEGEQAPWRRFLHTCMRYLLTPVLLKVLLLLHLEYRRPAGVHGQRSDRVKDVLFTDTVIGGREITCAPRPLAAENSVYPAETWSCYNIRVNGRRLQYWHMDGLCSEDKSASNSNDYGALCMAIMEAHRVHRPLWAALISNVSCKYSEEQRVVYEIGKEGNYLWRDYDRGRGFVLDLQCMADPDYKEPPHR